MKPWLAILAFLLIHRSSAEDNVTVEDVIGALRSATNVVLFSIDPEGPYRQPPLAGEKLYGSILLGKLPLTGKAAQAAISNTVSGIQRGKGFIGAHCFNPRLALLTISRGQKQECLLCYECGWISIARDNKGVARWGLNGSPEKLQALLKDANIPLANRD
jgi:hypothetical protein